MLVDFPKASDLMNHDILLDASKCIATKGVSLKWLRNYSNTINLRGYSLP